MSGHQWYYKIELSALVTVIGIILLFSGAVIVTLIAPNYVDSTWTQPSSQYQVQMYEVSDPHFYISSAVSGGETLQYVQHMVNDFTLSAYVESSTLKIKASSDLEKYVTREKDKELKLTSRLLLLKPSESGEYELYAPEKNEVFAVSSSDGVLQDWVDHDFVLVEEAKSTYHQKSGVIFVKNPIEYRVKQTQFGDQTLWQYDPEGEPVATIDQLRAQPLGFRSRQELIAYGEHIYAVQGCWYCHTDQTRTLVQDTVLNGSDSFPAPPSSPNEYIYQKITFPGTKRNGPDISRVGIKRPSRDWHKSHFWSPKTESKGSIMPSFRQFFDFDPRGTSRSNTGVPNHQFEAVFQYLMTKGTRITPPTQAWWLGKDPVNTIEIIEGQRKLP